VAPPASTTAGSTVSAPTAAAPSATTRLAPPQTATADDTTIALGSATFESGPLPAPYDTDPRLGGFRAGYVCEVIGVAGTYFEIAACRPAALHGVTFDDASEPLVDAIKARYPAPAISFWEAQGWKLIASGVVLLAFAWIVWRLRARSSRRAARVKRKTQFQLSAIDPSVAANHAAAWEHAPRQPIATSAWPAMASPSPSPATASAWPATAPAWPATASPWEVTASPWQATASPWQMAPHAPMAPHAQMVTASPPSPAPQPLPPLQPAYPVHPPAATTHRYGPYGRVMTPARAMEVPGTFTAAPYDAPATMHDPASTSSDRRYMPPAARESAFLPPALPPPPPGPPRYRPAAVVDDFSKTTQDVNYQLYVEREHAIRLARGSQPEELEKTRQFLPLQPRPAPPEPPAIRATRLRHPPVPKPLHIALLSHMPNRLS
jgi:hypothetical protein